MRLDFCLDIYTKNNLISSAANPFMWLHMTTDLQSFTLETSNNVLRGSLRSTRYSITNISSASHLDV